jgi:cleavage and polyadenylation specificity factor subunit 2
MSFTAFAAGHLLGGAIWQVLTPDEEQIVYAVHWNHRKDHHLRRADLEGRFSRPALLITDACSAHKGPLDVFRRDQDFVSRVSTTLKADGATPSPPPPTLPPHTPLPQEL